MNITKKILSLAMLAALGINVQTFCMENNQNNQKNDKLVLPSQIDMSVKKDDSYAYKREKIEEEVRNECIKNFSHLDSSDLQKKIDEEVEARIKLGVTFKIHATGKNPNKDVFKDNLEIEEVVLEKKEIISKEQADALGKELAMACKNNDIELAEQLIKAGAHVDYSFNESVGDYTYYNVTALDYAVENKNSEMVALLLASKVTIDADDLLCAVRMNSVEIVKLLLATKQDSITQEVLDDCLSAVCNYYYKAEDHSFEIIQLFVEHGAKPDDNALGCIIEKFTQNQDEWSADALSNVRRLMRLFQKMNAPITASVLKAIFNAPKEVQDLFLSGNIKVTKNEIDAFLNAYKYKINETEMAFLGSKYFSFDREIEYLNSAKIPHDAKAMKKYLVKIMFQEEDLLKEFVYKLACASGITATDIPLFRGKISFDQQFPLFQDPGVKNFFYFKDKGDFDGKEIKDIPIGSYFAAAALGHSKVIGKVQKDPLSEEILLTNELVKSWDKVFPPKYNSVLTEKQPLFNAAFQAAFINNQLDTAKMLIARCNVANDKIFNLVKNNIDSLVAMKKSLQKHNAFMLQDENDINKILALTLAGDKELLKFEETQHELKLFLCNMRSFMKALQSKGISHDVAMHIIQYALDCNRLPINQIKKVVKKPQQKLITDFFKKKN